MVRELSILIYYKYFLVEIVNMRNITIINHLITGRSGNSEFFRPRKLVSLDP